MEAALNKIRVNRYPAYKDSGVEWLGEIPEHWALLPGFAVFEERNEKNSGLGEDKVLSLSFGKIIIKPKEKLTGLVPESFENYQKVYPGDIIIRPTDLQNDKISLRVGIAKNKGIITSAYLNLKTRNGYCKSYYYYFFHSIDITKVIYGLGTGLRQNLRFTDFKKFIFLCPNQDEQIRISDLLDKKIEQIDKAIGQKERIIELLKEKRQILIQRAVTRGLDPKVKMKDSGVEWIGEIPEHWKIKALKYIAFLQSGMTISSDSFTEDGFPVYGGNGFRGYTSTYTNEGQFALVGRQGALCGNVNYAKGKFFASEHAIVVYPKDNENYFWLGETIRIADFNRLSQSAAQPGIAVNVVKNVLFPYPPVYEQSLIAQYLEKVYLKIDKTVSFKETEIEKLKEFKATLINSAVTGKIKV